jgi:DNA-binding NtrC family response regulator
MGVDVLLAVADEALRTVLEIALTADGCTVRAAATEDQVLDSMSAEPARTLILDVTAPFGERILAWAERVRPTLALLLLTPAWGGAPVTVRRDVTTLPMPFGRQELRRALASAIGATGR